MGVSEAAENTSFAAMAEKQQALAKVILQNPNVDNLASFIGIDGTNITPNSGRIQVNLKPRNQRKETASEIIRDLQPELAKVEGITLYMQPVQDLTVESRVSRTQYQYSMEDADAAELATWLDERLPGSNGCLISEVGAVIGAHTGPGVLGVVVLPGGIGEPPVTPS